MVITEDNDLDTTFEVRNSEGKVVKYIKEFNTETKEALMYGIVSYQDVSYMGVGIKGERLSGDREVVTFRCHLLRHKAYNKETGEEIK